MPKLSAMTSPLTSMISHADSPDKVPVLGGLAVGLVASLCCGGGLIFGAIGLGAAYGALHIARYIPEALAAGSILVALLNWLYHRRKAKQVLAAGACNCSAMRRTMLWSVFFGLAMMTGSFIFLEWLNHGVVHAAHFMANPAYADAIIPGVPNAHLGYLALTYLALPILAVLPLPNERSSS